VSLRVAATILINPGLWYLSLALTVLVLYGFLTGNWWYGDDPEIIVFALKHSPCDYLLNPDIWQSFSPFNFVPWVIASLQIDVLFSDFAPFGYYLHQFIALVIVALILFKVFNLFIEKALFAFSGVLIFLLTPSTLSVVSWLSTRHYLEGMGFSLLSIYFFVRGLRSDKFILTYVSALWYIFGALSKEVYVPLPFLLVLLPEKTFRERLRYSIPLFGISALYVLYRIWMLGDNPVGGYSSVWPWTFSSALLNSPDVFRLYAGSWWVFFLVSITILWGIHYVNGWKSTGKEALRYILMFVLFYLPILPVSSILSGGESLRYLLLTSTVITSFYVLSLNSIWEKGGQVHKILAAASLVIIVTGFYHGFKEQKNTWDTKKTEASAEGKFFLNNMGGTDAVFRINQPHWFFDGLEKMKEEELEKRIERKIKLVYGEFYGFNKDTEETVRGLRVFAYNRNSKIIADITQDARKAHAEFLGTIQAKPLSVFIHIKEAVMNIELGPYEGLYILLEASPSQPDFYYLAFPIGKRFGIKLTHRERVRIFRFAYASPEGWTALSPEFLIDWSKNQTITWSRT
jgi:hypothetical protein